ncbi:MAG: hypothetical protein P4L61_02490, partial [Candidatus Pacebacteria bacterium]|nr:hypothetical protein [Candidatus Paceibacterota bacterium]
AQTASQVAAQSDQASTTSAGAAMSSTTTIDNVRTNATGGSNNTATQPATVITSILPSSVAVGSTVTITGQNLNGFEGSTWVTLKNSSGQTGVIEANSNIPAGVSTLKITIPSSACTGSMGESGKACPSYLTITPGTYSVSVQPWSVMSNSLPLVVTSSSASALQTYTNSQYGFSIGYPSTWNVQVGTWNGAGNNEITLKKNNFTPGSAGDFEVSINIGVSSQPAASASATNVQVAGVTATKADFAAGTQSGPYTQYSLTKNGIVYLIEENYNNPRDYIGDQIVSTFHFTNN